MTNQLRYIAYLRVSTAEQAVSGLGLDAQRQLVSDHARAHGWAVLRWAEDTGSGKSLRKRPALAEAIAAVEAGEADGIVVAKLDRLSRSVLDFSGLVCRAEERHWNLVVLDLGLDLATPQGRFTAHVLCAAAQLERELIGNRTRDALAAAKARGNKVGRPRQVPDDVAARILDLAEHGHEGFAAIARMLNAEDVPAPRGGGVWHPSTVARIVARERKAVA